MSTPNGKVFVYFNLHRKVWSVKALSGPQRGRVIAHVRSIALTDCAFRVSEAGRQRVLRERRKNVHAGVVGRLQEWHAAPVSIQSEGIRVTYNPYVGPHFTECETDRRLPVSSARRVVLAGRSVTAEGVS